MVKEDNVRTGFLTDDEYARLLAELPDELRLLFVVSYSTGVRRGELLGDSFFTGRLCGWPDNTRTSGNEERLRTDCAHP